MMSDQNDSNKFELNYKDTTFWGLLKADSFSSFKNWSFVWALILTSIITIYILNQKNSVTLLSLIADKLNETLLGASAGIFSIVIASLTITLTLFHESLLPIMLKEGLLQKYFFPFWQLVSLWSISIVVCFILIILEVINIPCIISKLIVAEFFIFLYATFYTVNLTGLVIRLALQKAQIEK
jgi:hypothetical protein